MMKYVCIEAKNIALQLYMYDQQYFSIFDFSLRKKRIDTLKILAYTQIFEGFSFIYRCYFYYYINLLNVSISVSIINFSNNIEIF
jgi:hypothetical protein